MLSNIGQARYITQMEHKLVKHVGAKCLPTFAQIWPIWAGLGHVFANIRRNWPKYCGQSRPCVVMFGPILGSQSNVSTTGRDLLDNFGARLWRPCLGRHSAAAARMKRACPGCHARRSWAASCQCKPRSGTASSRPVPSIGLVMHPTAPAKMLASAPPLRVAPTQQRPRLSRARTMLAWVPPPVTKHERCSA